MKKLMGVLCLSMALVVAAASPVSAAKKPSLDKKVVTVSVKKSTTVKLRNAKIKKVSVKSPRIASVKWSKGKKSLRVTGKKAGKTTVKVYYSGKKYCTLKVTVKNTKKSNKDGKSGNDDGIVTSGANEDSGVTTKEEPDLHIRQNGSLSIVGYKCKNTQYSAWVPAENSIQLRIDGDTSKLQYSFWSLEIDDWSYSKKNGLKDPKKLTSATKNDVCSVSKTGLVTFNKEYMAAHPDWEVLVFFTYQYEISGLNPDDDDVYHDTVCYWLTAADITTQYPETIVITNPGSCYKYGSFAYQCTGCGEITEEHEVNEGDAEELETGEYIKGSKVEDAASKYGAQALLEATAPRYHHYQPFVITKQPADKLPTCMEDFGAAYSECSVCGKRLNVMLVRIQCGRTRECTCTDGIHDGVYDDTNPHYVQSRKDWESFQKGNYFGGYYHSVPTDEKYGTHVEDFDSSYRKYNAPTAMVYLYASNDVYAQKCLDSVNAYRAENGLSQLSLATTSEQKAYSYVRCAETCFFCDDSTARRYGVVESYTLDNLGALYNFTQSVKVDESRWSKADVFGAYRYEAFVGNVLLDSASVENGVSNYTVIGDSICYNFDDEIGTHDRAKNGGYDKTNDVIFDLGDGLRNPDGTVRTFSTCGFPRLAESGVDWASGGNISATFTTDSIIDADHATEWQ